MRNSPRRIRPATIGLRRKDGNSETYTVPTNVLRIAGISTTDLDATPMRLKGGGIYLGYHTHYVVDGGKRRILSPREGNVLASMDWLTRTYDLSP